MITNCLFCGKEMNASNWRGFEAGEQAGPTVCQECAGEEKSSLIKRIIKLLRFHASDCEHSLTLKDWPYRIKCKKCGQEWVNDDD